MTVKSAIIRAALEAAKFQICRLLGGAGPAAAAPARVDALIPCVVVLPTHNVSRIQSSQLSALSCIASVYRIHSIIALHVYSCTCTDTTVICIAEPTPESFKIANHR